MRIPFRDLIMGGAPEGGTAAKPESPVALGENEPLFAEQVKALRAKFEARAEALKLKVVAVTSAVAGEGKTLLTAKLAMNLASGGRKKVLLVGLDLRKADMAPSLGLNPLPGMTEYLAGSVDRNAIFRHAPVCGLYVIPPGMRISNPTDLLSGERFRTFLLDMREQFDIVLIDTPPVLPVADALLVRELVDGFLMLYRVKRTPHEMFKQAAEEIGDKKILGVVLNGVDQPRQKHYEKYYGSYYRIQKDAPAPAPAPPPTTLPA